MAQVLRHVPAQEDPTVLVSSATLDDAAVVRLADDALLVQTVDLFGPPVDDAYDYGRIAAANAISDVYAMGGVPRYALAILAVPADLDRELVGEILRGGSELAAAAGVTIIGGHTVTAPEPLYGLAVTGMITGGAPWTNAGGTPGDLLCLSKPLGTGIVCNALRKDAASAEVIARAIEVMVTTNAAAAGLLHGVRPSAVVDVTGFGLVGHAHAMGRESGCAVRIDLDALPIIEGVQSLVAAGLIPGGSKRNRTAAEEYLIVDPDADEVRVILACDAQTSGGLLAAVPAAVDPAALPGPIIGRLVDGTAGTVQLA